MLEHMETTYKTVITLLDVHSFDQNAVPSSAQAFAVSRKLPCAVVVRYDRTDTLDDDVFERLGTYERKLASYSVPLLLMFGDEQAVVAALERHFQPKFFYELQKGELKNHPYEWRGTVQDVATLRTYIAEVGVDGVCEV